MLKRKEIDMALAQTRRQQEMVVKEFIEREKNDSWSQLQGLEPSPADREETVRFARKLDDRRLDDLLRPFETR